MLEFFRGWKRKVGVVTLAVACVAMVGWVRSIQHSDVVKVPCGQKMVSLIASTNYGIVWSATDVIQEHYKLPSADRIEWKSGPNERFTAKGMLFPWSLCQIFDTFEYGHDEDPADVPDWIIWHREYDGFHFALAKADFPPLVHVTTWILPYWSIVIPFTAISAWLLLSKPGTKIKRSITPPIENS